MKFDEESARKSFMIIDKDIHHKKKNYFNIFIFKLQSEDSKNDTINYISDPIFKGMVEFEKIGLDEVHQTIEPFRFWKRIRAPDIKDLKNDIEKNLQVLNPRLFLKLFKAVKFIVIPFEQEIEDDISPIYDMAKRYQREDIRRYQICDRCKKHRTFTLLGKDGEFINLNKKKICKDCAGKELFKLLKDDYNIDVTPSLKLLMAKQLLKFKSVQKVLSMFEANFNPLSNREITLFDTKSESKEFIEKLNKIKPIIMKDLEIPDILKEYYIFNEINELLPIQTMAVQNGLLNHESLLIISSTSSGKTLLGELPGFSRILEGKFDKFPIPPEIKSLTPKDQKIANNAYFKNLIKIRPHGKMLYLVPIVALASLRYEEYKDLNQIGIQVALKVGKSFFEQELDKEIATVSNSDVIIGTYEAIDYMLRSSGKRSLDSVSTIVIDEIQMLNDEERGWILDGLIARLKYLYPNAQFLFLSATVSDPKILANHYRCKLIEFMGRPVPMERHLILSLNEFEKQKTILMLADEEFKHKSSYKYKGQTLVFTNSRRKCHIIADFLSNNGVSAAAYHGGLMLVERRKIEALYSKQIISTVITTAALAAGVDFPASQVIFESLSMGIQWLTVAEFEQMSGRAGRYKKHDMAKVVVLIEPGKIYQAGQQETEDRVALRLLNGKIESIKLEPNEDRMYTELLAFISMRSGYLANDEEGILNIDSLLDEKEDKDLIRQFVEKIQAENKIKENIPRNDESKTSASKKDLIEFQNSMFNNDYDLTTALNYLLKNKLIALGKSRPNGVKEISATRLGRAIAESFFPISQALKIKDSLIQNKNLFEGEIARNDGFDVGVVNIEETDQNSVNLENINISLFADFNKQAEPMEDKYGKNIPIMIALDLNPLKNIYITNAVVSELAPKSGGKKFSNVLFGNQTLSVLNAENLGYKSRLSKFIKDILLLWTKEIFNCKCKDSPYCSCGRRNIEKKILELETKGFSLHDVSNFLKKRWNIQLYMGDLIDYFDAVIHNLKSIYKIAKSCYVNDEMKSQIEEIPKLIKNMKL